MIERLLKGTAFAEAVSVREADGRWIHVSGNVGFGPDGRTVVPGGIEAEARATFANIADVLQRSGATLEHVVKLLAFIVDVEDYAGYGRVRQETFAGHLPASSTIVVSGFVVEARLEVEAVAFVPAG